MKKKLFSILLILVLAFTACTNEVAEEPEEETAVEPINVVVSIVPQRTFVERVAGDKVNITVMVPPGFSPGNYEPTPQEIEEFSKSKIYFSIGVPAEQANILPVLSDYPDIKEVKLYEIVRETKPDRELAPGTRDPHIWLSPRRVMIMVEAIAEELSMIDPGNAEYFATNAEAFIAKLEALDLEMKEVLADIEDGSFIVYHPAFGYLADDYGLRMYALENDGGEASPQDMQAMIDLALERNIQAVFYQSEISSRQAEALAEEIGGKTIQLAPLSPDYINNLLNMANLFAEIIQ